MPMSGSLAVSAVFCLALSLLVYRHEKAGTSDELSEFNAMPDALGGADMSDAAHTVAVTPGAALIQRLHEKMQTKMTALDDAATADDAVLIQNVGTQLHNRHRRERSQLKEAMRSRYSNEGQDEWVLATIASLRTAEGPKTFVEIGARDGDFFSNTRRLEEHSWTGTCIEPHPTNFEKFNRTCRLVQKALVAKVDPSRVFSDCEDGSGVTGWSGFTDKNKQKDEVTSCTQKTVPQTTFVDLNEPSVIDYVSLDIEGAELEILKAFPFDKHCARMWTIEGAGSEYVSSTQQEIVELMQSHGCQKVKTSPSDGFFTCSCA
eukprot:gnl/TRDRNA2_/TRDRNA2_66581_c0_seq1.p1 gnl/TRDRNA2_/TRDRNA2_66581_c0~~gnl/TRDRNA2_/TRDRNA2_66581_c0_seq1.p1  ORF type:complete len:318 (+),score=61.08 gnl/TRDRNA2_/TRDRNA2_66581_c0_seq1:76-1029(+)